ncbi:MAG: isoprenylcysteine carboxylmethyltransferase family protein [Bacteroidales bacterium]|jgi:protein-S-isoprenylcysteine O-methyltransferase Ste14|nr:isoprenylcysteine carboxylmethyltransferase family protein [Bacteroidales bacterium]
MKVFLAPIRWIIITGLVFFAASGDLSNVRVWIYLAIYALGGIAIGILLYKKAPQLLKDREKMQEGTKPLDKYIILTYFLLALFVTPLVAGLDRRIHLADTLPFAYLYAGIILYLLSAVFSVWPMIHNPFFETTVRIQENKSHQVIRTGPYRIVRHPGYLGMILSSLSMPLVLGSIFALIPMFIMVVLMVLRTYYEDTTLQRELHGYADYCRDVRYRLVPYVW